MTTENSENFLPKNESARIAVARARQIVKENNEMVSKMKSESNIEVGEREGDIFASAESFSHENSHSFDLYKIKSTNGIRDFIKDIFKVH